MSDSINDERRERAQTSIFDERPGTSGNVKDDLQHPESVAPDVVAPDLSSSTVFDNGTLPIPNGGRL